MCLKHHIFIEINLHRSPFAPRSKGRGFESRWIPWAERKNLHRSNFEKNKGRWRNCRLQERSTTSIWSHLTAASFVPLSKAKMLTIQVQWEWEYWGAIHQLLSNFIIFSSRLLPLSWVSLSLNLSDRPTQKGQLPLTFGRLLAASFDGICCILW